MRLFAAVNIDEKLKPRISRLMEEVKRITESGNFTREQNLHITLQFIGETGKISAAMEAVKSVRFEKFVLKFTRISRFRRKGGDICWLGVENETELKKLAEAVGKELKKRGFILEERGFQAHVTLGRELVFKKGCEPEKIPLPEDFAMEVVKISLMKSERIRGLLTYTEIGEKAAEERSAD